MVALFALVFAGLLSAQTPRSFDVASVKPGDPDDRNAFIQLQQGGRLVVRNIPLQQIILWAYQLRWSDVGLRLESTRGAVEVSVIDRIERPTPD